MRLKQKAKDRILIIVIALVCVGIGYAAGSIVMPEGGFQLDSKISLSGILTIFVTSGIALYFGFSFTRIQNLKGAQVQLVSDSIYHTVSCLSEIEKNALAGDWAYDEAGMNLKQLRMAFSNADSLRRDLNFSVDKSILNSIRTRISDLRTLCTETPIIDRAQGIADQHEVLVQDGKITYSSSRKMLIKTELEHLRREISQYKLAIISH